MELTMEILVGLAVLVGLIGIVFTVLPGSLLIGAAVLVWASFTGTALGWWTFAGVAVLLTLGMVGSKVIAARQTKVSGTATRSLVFAGLLGVVGFFVIPLVGLVVGFVLGLWLAEYQRLGESKGAWASAKAGLKGTALGMLAELATGLVAATAWAIAAIYT